MQLFGRQLLSWQQGKKTYLTALAMVAGGVYVGFGGHVPEWAVWLLGAAGVGFNRAGVSQVAADVIETKATLQTVLDMVSTPAKK